MARLRAEIAWVIGFAIATAAGTVLAADPSRLTLSHSAVGVGALWLSRPGRRPAWPAIAIALLTTGAALATGVNLPTAAVLAASTLAGAAFAAAAAGRRWPQGVRLDGLGDVASLVLVAAGAGVLASVVGAAAVTGQPGGGWPLVALVGVRATLGVWLAVGVAAAWAAFPRPPRPRLVGQLGVDAALTCAVLAILIVEERSLPLLFAAVPLTLWIAARGSLLRLMSHAAVAGATIVVFTAWGFGHLARQGFYIGAIGAEVYVLVLTTTGAILAVVRLQADSAKARAESAGEGLKAALNANPAALVGVRTDGGAVMVTGSNGAAQLLLSASADSLKGTTFTELLPAHDRRLLEAGFDSVARGTVDSWTGHVSLVRGTSVTKRLEVTARRWQDTYPGRLLLNLSDITAAWQVRERLSWAALHDPETGLPNRAMVAHRIVAAIYSSLTTHSHTAVVVIEVDGWRAAQEQLDWKDGGRLLGALGARLQQAARARDLMGLTSDAQFVVCCPDIADVGHATDLANHLRLAVAQPLVIADQVVQLKARAGIAVCEDLSTPDELIARAQLAMRQPCPDAHPGVSVWTQGLAEAATRDRALHQDLNHATEDGQLRLHYQPVIDIATGATTAVEALVRWEHPHQGLLPPASWIGIAETHGTIVEIGNWVLREACTQIAALRADGHDLTIQVNVSARQLRDADIAAQVLDALTAARAHPTWLVLEITETHLLHVDDSLIETLEGLRRSGVRIAVDDFGTGFSTLQAVTQMPVDELKIDRSFVQGLGTDPRSAAVINGVIGIARGMGASVVAEGVETPDQARALAQAGCSLAQGFLWSRPLPGDVLRRYLTTPTHETIPSQRDHAHSHSLGLISTPGGPAQSWGRPVASVASAAP